MRTRELVGGVAQQRRCACYRARPHPPRLGAPAVPGFPRAFATSRRGPRPRPVRVPSVSRPCPVRVPSVSEACRRHGFRYVGEGATTGVAKIGMSTHRPLFTPPQSLSAIRSHTLGKRTTLLCCNYTAKPTKNVWHRRPSELHVVACTRSVRIGYAEQLVCVGLVAYPGRELPVEPL